MNPSGASNRIFDGHIEPMRQPHMNLIDATQGMMELQSYLPICRN